MKATFSYTGERLHISMSLDGEGDQAIAKLVERMTEARVSVSYENASQYDYRDPKPDGIHVTLRAPDKAQPENPYSE